MKFDIKKFKSNLIFFILCIAFLVIALVLSLIEKNVATLDEEELPTDESSISKLVINEVMSSNKGTFTDDDGMLYDYVEIYNGNSHSINLKNYGLSDTNNEIKYTFPSIEIESKGYLIVYLSGTTSDNLHAPFKLKASGGETLGLFKPNGKVVDAIETVSLVKDTVMARNSDGKWVIQKDPTPGYPNTIEGHENFIKSLTEAEEGKIEINEVLANNKGNFKNSFGEYSGYIEVRNKSDKSINIENYSISNSDSVIYKWKFPSLVLEPGEVAVVFTSNKNITEGDELHASFKLDSKNGVVVLSNKEGKIIDKITYENLANGIALIKQDGNMLESNIISPGESNTVDGIKSFQKKYMQVPNDLIINEAMNKNYSLLAQNGGSYYDWIELYNNSNNTIKLKEYCLTTNTESMCLYNLPDVELKKGEYYILMASGDENLSNNSYKHANFNISETQAVYITKASKVIDSMFITNVPSGYSMGRSGSYGLYYFSSPTPGKGNGNGTQAISYAPNASVKTGVFNNVENVSVELAGSGNIYYTLDGSNPTTSSKVYSSPLILKSTTVLKTMSSEPGKLQSEVNTYSYIINENHTLPVMSVVIDPKDLKALHSHAWVEGYKKDCFAELIELDGTGFSVSAGLKLFGGATRGHAKKSYELKFQKQYGDAKLHYQVFDDVDSSVFDSIVLRSGSQDEMGDASKKTLIRDIVGTSLVSEYTSVDVQSYKAVAMYINGSYWGLYFIREKVDETFVGNHYNVNATKSNTDLLRIDNQVKSGSTKKYNQMLSFISNNSLSNSSNYEKIKEQIDIENLCDFWIAETWTANNDIVNVRFFSNNEIDNGKWKFIFYDLDFAYYNVNRNYFTFSTSTSGMTSNGYSTFLLRNLMKSDEFKKTYLERLSYNLKNTWNPDNVIKKIDDVINEIGTDEIKRNLSRWNVMSYDKWLSNVDYLKSYAKKRKDYVISQAKSYFNLSNAEVEKYFGGL